MYLLHFGSRTPKQLDVALPQDLLVLFESVLGVLLAGEKHKSVAGGPSIGVLDKEQALGAICDRTLWAQEGQHILGRGRERQAPHADDHLVLLGQELGHLIRCACSRRTTIQKGRLVICLFLFNWGCYFVVMLKFEEF